jgi:hypothetical protein
MVALRSWNRGERRIDVVVYVLLEICLTEVHEIRRHLRSKIHVGVREHMVLHAEIHLREVSIHHRIYLRLIRWGRILLSFKIKRVVHFLFSSR